MRKAQLWRLWLGGMLVVGGLVAGTTQARAETIALPMPDPMTGEVSDETKLAFLFHYRYADVTLPDAWDVKVNAAGPAAALIPAPVWATPGAPGPSSGPEILLSGGSESVGTSAVPEPATLLLLGLGALGTLIGRRRRA